MAEFKSKVHTAEKRISELKSEEITQNASKRQKYRKLWLRKVKEGVRRSNIELIKVPKADNREDGLGGGGDILRKVAENFAKLRNPHI